MKTVKLYGVLADKFGKKYRLSVNSTKEAMRALCVQIPGFEEFMTNAHLKKMRFAVYHDNVNIGEDELDLNNNVKEIRIVPIIEGAGGKALAWLQVIAGVVMIGVGIFATGGANIALIGAGIGLLLGGISMMMMPQVDTQDQNEDGNKPNKGFGGAVTTVAQGNPVPILYGEREIGGFIVSASQETEDLLAGYYTRERRRILGGTTTFYIDKKTGGVIDVHHRS